MGIPYVQYGQDGLSAYDASGIRRIWLNPAGLLLSFFDTDGVTPRCEIGNLPTRGISAAGWGFRVNDAAGSPIYDSTGLVKVMDSIGAATIAWGTTNFAGVAGSSGISGFGGEVVILNYTFTTTRTQTVRLDFSVMGGVASTAGTLINIAPIYLRVTGQVNSPSGGLPIHLTTDTQGIFYSSSGSYQILPALPTATYTVNIYWNSANGISDTLTVKTAQANTFLMGG